MRSTLALLMISAVAGWTVPAVGRALTPKATRCAGLSMAGTMDEQIKASIASSKVVSESAGFHTPSLPIHALSLLHDLRATKDVCRAPADASEL